MPLPEPVHFDHNEVFTCPIPEHIVGAKAATLILRGVITTGQPPDAPGRQLSSSRCASGVGGGGIGRQQYGFAAAAPSAGGATSEDGSSNHHPNPATTPATPPVSSSSSSHSGKMAALFANLPTPGATPSPTSSGGSDFAGGMVRGKNPPASTSTVLPERRKPKDKRLGPDGPRPMTTRRVVSATGAVLNLGGIRGRGLGGGANRAASASVTINGHGITGGVAGGGALTTCRRSSRLMNLYISNSGEEQADDHHEYKTKNNNANDDDDGNDGGLVPPSKKAKKK